MSWSKRRAQSERFLHRWQHWLRIVPTVVALVLYAHHARRFIARTSFEIDGARYYSLFDDGMISMRYAWNLAHGHGLVWNPGERVEGYTNLLWTLVMAAFTALLSKPAAVLAMQILGAVLLGLAAVIYARTAEHLLPPRRWVVVALIEGVIVFAITSIYPLRFWSFMGMEVSALLLVNAIAWWLALRRPSHRAAQYIGALLALAYAIRPDGFLPLVPALVLALVEARATPRRILLGLLPLCGAVLALLAWRRFYYGSDVPNTYLLKMGAFPLRFRLENGWGFVAPYLWQTLPMWIVAAFVLCRRRDARSLSLLASAVSTLAYQVYVGGDPWPYWRQMSPGYPLFALFVVMAADDLLRLPGALIERVAGWSLPRAVRTVASFLLPLACHGLLFLVSRPTAGAFRGSAVLKFNVAWNKANVERGLLLQQILEDQGRIAVVWAGATPYYCSSCFAIDLLGKCDVHVASRDPDLSGKIAWSGMKSVPGHNKSDVEYSLDECRADYTETLEWGNDHATLETKKQFTGVSIRGQGFMLRTGSPRVRWDDVARMRD